MWRTVFAIAATFAAFNLMVACGGGESEPSVETTAREYVLALLKNDGSHTKMEVADAPAALRAAYGTSIDLLPNQRTATVKVFDRAGSGPGADPALAPLGLEVGFHRSQDSFNMKFKNMVVFRVHVDIVFADGSKRERAMVCLRPKIATPGSVIDGDEVEWLVVPK